MEKNKQLLILFVAIVILSLVAVLFLFTGERGKNQIKPGVTVTPTKISYLTPTQKITPTPTLYIPTGKKIELEGIAVNDIYAKPLMTNNENDVKFAENSNYEFVYLSKYHKFLITILGSPFMSLVKPAEEDFVKVLGITYNQACKLNVDVGTVAFANPDYAGKRFPLSFCKK
jgi:hypothetical protein